MEIFEEIIFSHLEYIKRDKVYPTERASLIIVPSEQPSLIIMNLFKGQGNDISTEHWSNRENNVVKTTKMS